MPKSFNAYRFLTHAMMHCKWGSEPTDREPDQADIDAAMILLAARLALTAKGE